MKSISRYVFIVGGGAFQDVLKIIFVSPYLWWSQNTLLAQLLSKRQSSLDDSYRAWMLRYIQMILSLFIVANTSAITYTKHSKYHGKSKYIDTKYILFETSLCRFKLSLNISPLMRLLLIHLLNLSQEYFSGVNIVNLN
jgi:hypothetical protein